MPRTYVIEGTTSCHVATEDISRKDNKDRAVTAPAGENHFTTTKDLQEEIKLGTPV